jgi:7 transmembrane receptor (rhodopsin family)
LILISIIGTSGSLLCLLTICRRKSNLHSTVNPFFVNQSISIFIFSFLCCPLQAYISLAGFSNLLNTPMYSPVCKAVAFINLETLTVNVLTQVSIALHRFFVIVLSDNRLICFRSRYCTSVLMVLPWPMSAIVYVFPLFNLGGEYSYNPNLGRCGFLNIYATAYHEFLRSFFFFFSYTVLVVCYTTIVVKVRISRRRSAPIRSKKTGKMNREERITIRALLLCVIFTIFFLPSTIQGLVEKNSAMMYSSFGLAAAILLSFGMFNFIHLFSPCSAARN